MTDEEVMYPPDDRHLHWLLYKSPNTGRTWHAWRAGDSQTVCKGRCRRNRFVARQPDRPTEGERVCRSCLRQLGLAVPPRKPKKKAPTKEDCTGEPTCACARHREVRRRGADEFLARVEDEIGKLACGCIRFWLREAWESEEFRQAVEEAEQRFRLNLFLWEMNGDLGLQRETGWRGAAGELRKVWESVRIGFHSRGHEHHCSTYREP